MSGCRGNSDDSCHKDKTEKLYQYYINWFLTLVIIINAITGHSIALPSLYGFITNPPDTSSCEGTAGLGESKTIFSIAYSMYDLGSIIGAIIIAVLGGRLVYKALLVIGLTSQIVGYLIYGFSTSGWMVIIARILIGICNGASFSSIYSYYNYSVTRYNALAEKLSKKQRPKLFKALVLLLATFGSITYIPVIGLTSLVASVFPSVNQFRWIAWFVASFSGVTLVSYMILFKDMTDYCICLHTGRSKENIATSSNRQEHKDKQKPTITTIIVS